MDTEKTTDFQLIECYLSGDAACFSLLAERHIEAAFGCAMALLSDEIEAHNVVEEALNRMALELTTLRPDSVEKMVHAFTYEVALEHLLQKHDKTPTAAESAMERALELLNETIDSDAMLTSKTNRRTIH